MTSRVWIAPYSALVGIWGFSFLFNNVALRTFTPMQVVFGRIALGALTLGLVVAVSRQWPQLRGRDIADLLVLAVTLNAAPFLLIAVAQTSITSILAGLLNATTPLWAAVFVATLLPAERPSRIQLIGVLIGLAGVSVMLGAWQVDQVPWGGVLAMLGATACYGFGTAWSRRRLTSGSLSGTGLSAVQLAFATVILLPFFLLGGLPTSAALASAPAVGSIAILGILGAGLAYVLFWQVVRQVGAVVTTTVTYAIPVVSTAAGVLILAEKLHWYEPVGAVVVLLGVALTQRR